MGIQVFKSGSTVSAYLKLAGGVTLSSSLVSVVDQSDNVSPLQLATASAQFVAPLFLSVPAWTLGGARSNFILTSTVASAVAGANTYKMINNVYTINNTAAQTGTITGIFQNVTETALNGITHNLMDLQVGGVSKFKVDRTGLITANGFQSLAYNESFQRVGFNNGANFNSLGYIQAISNGVFRLANAAENDFSRLQLGGSTSSFPAIKRNGAAIDFRLADDSNYAAINAGATYIKGAGTGSGSAILVENSAGTTVFRVKDNGDCTLGASSDFGNVSGTGCFFRYSLAVGTLSNATASAILQADSTTRGFLPPRMTTAQINAIVSPANGLMVYNTTQLEPCFYDGTGWKRLLHLAM